MVTIETSICMSSLLCLLKIFGNQISGTQPSLAGVKAGCVRLCWVAGDPIWQVLRWISIKNLSLL